MRRLLLPFTFLLAASCAAPEAAADSAEAQKTLTVTGRGEAVAAPDLAVVTIGVQTDGATAAEALRANAAAMSATIASLKSMDIADRDIQTSGLSVNPRYDYERNRSAPEVIGFRASNSVRVRLRDLDQAGAVIDEAVSTGANSLGGVSFTFADPKPLYEEARRDAVADAKARAEQLADAAGVRLGPILRIDEGAAPGLRPERMVVSAARMEADFAAPPIEAGESSLTAHVTLIYAID